MSAGSAPPSMARYRCRAAGNDHRHHSGRSESSALGRAPPGCALPGLRAPALARRVRTACTSRGGPAQFTRHAGAQQGIDHHVGLPHPLHELGLVGILPGAHQGDVQLLDDIQVRVFAARRCGASPQVGGDAEPPAVQVARRHQPVPAIVARAHQH